MSAHHDVDRAVGQAGDDLLGLLVGLEAAQSLDRDREAGHPLAEGRQVLGDQERRRHQHRDLLAVLDRLERRPDRDLGLAVADVAAHETVHRHGLAHVGLDLVDRAELVGGLGEGEGVLELALPGSVRPEGVALGGLTRGVQLDQLGGDLAHRLAGAALALGPVGTAQPVEAGLLAAHVAGDLVQRVGGHVEAVRRSAPLRRAVLQHEVLALGALHLALLHLHETPDAVLLVDDVVAGLELEGVDLLLATGGHLAHVARRGLLARDVLAGQEHQAVGGVDEPLDRAAAGDDHGPDGQVVEGLDTVGQTSRHLALGERLHGALGRTVTGVDDEHPVGVRAPALDVGQRLLDVAAVAVHGRRGQGHRGDTGRGVVAGCLGRGVRVEAERAQGPPRQVALQDGLADVADLAVGRRTEVDR